MLLALESLYLGTAASAVSLGAPTPLPKASALNLTGLLVPVPGAEVSFPNSGLELLAVMNTGSAQAVTTAIGKTVEGQPVTPVTGTLPGSALSLLGPWPLDFSQPDHTVQVTFASVPGLSVALLRFAGVL